MLSCKVSWSSSLSSKINSYLSSLLERASKPGGKIEQCASSSCRQDYYRWNSLSRISSSLTKWNRNWLSSICGMLWSLSRSMLITRWMNGSLKGFDERSDGKKTLWASDEAYPLSIIATSSIQHAHGRTKEETFIGISVEKIHTLDHDELSRDSSDESVCDKGSLAWNRSVVFLYKKTVSVMAAAPAEDWFSSSDKAYRHSYDDDHPGTSCSAFAEFSLICQSNTLLKFMEQLVGILRIWIIDNRCYPNIDEIDIKRTPRGIFHSNLCWNNSLCDQTGNASK